MKVVPGDVVRPARGWSISKLIALGVGLIAAGNDRALHVCRRAARMEQERQ